MLVKRRLWVGIEKRISSGRPRGAADRYQYIVLFRPPCLRLPATHWLEDKASPTRSGFSVLHGVFPRANGACALRCFWVHLRQQRSRAPSDPMPQLSKAMSQVPRGHVVPVRGPRAGSGGVENHNLLALRVTAATTPANKLW
jgi:hypothetical protein